MFLILIRNILSPQQMFPSLRAQGNVMSNNTSATMCRRLPPPLVEGKFESEAGKSAERKLPSSII